MLYKYWVVHSVYVSSDYKLLLLIEWISFSGSGFPYSSLFLFTNLQSFLIFRMNWIFSYYSRTSLLYALHWRVQWFICWWWNQWIGIQQHVEVSNFAGVWYKSLHQYLCFIGIIQYSSNRYFVSILIWYGIGNFPGSELPWPVIPIFVRFRFRNCSWPVWGHRQSKENNDCAQVIYLFL